MSEILSAENIGVLAGGRVDFQRIAEQAFCGESEHCGAPLKDRRLHHRDRAAAGMVLMDEKEQKLKNLQTARKA